MRWIYRLIGLIAVLVVVAVGALFLIPSDRIAAVATRQFEAATGRAMTISGPVRPTLWPRLGVRIEGVALANVAGSDAADMVSAPWRRAHRSSGKRCCVSAVVVVTLLVLCCGLPGSLLVAAGTTRRVLCVQGRQHRCCHG